ncbi:gas2 domain containing protein [Stylonychia lemnae]|uniref:Gas2 domain containing protein n=1 Tax=Stylonychia lemnae TaxID=5949 RepID=A0A078ASD2_STYLE|nr:gas2 domain containing protein [Stylonychia lemnae]|eukprot:CDW83803.1 gas2 domain containing protein [Stylonychia lemnae]
MGCFCSKSKDLAQGIDPSLQPIQRKRTQEEDDLLKSLQIQLKIMENKIKLTLDALNDFQISQVDQEIKSLDSKTQEKENDSYKNAIELLQKLKRDCQDIANQMNDVRNLKSKQLGRLQDIEEGEPGAADTIQKLREIEQNIKVLNDKITQLENALNQLKDLLASYKDSSGLIQKINDALNLLENELPQIRQSIDKLNQMLKPIEILIQDGIHDNQNYDKASYEKDGRQALVKSEGQIQNLNKNIQNLEQQVKECVQNRDAETSRQGKAEPADLAKLFGKVQDIQKNRDQCKSEFDKIKKDFKEIRGIFGELSLLSITQSQLDLIKKEVDYNSNQLNKDTERKLQHVHQELISFQQELKKQNLAAATYEEITKLALQSKQLSNLVKEAQQEVALCRLQNIQQLLHEESTKLNEDIQNLLEVYHRLPELEKSKVDEAQQNLIQVKQSSEALAMKAKNSNETDVINQVHSQYEKLIRDIRETANKCSSVEIPPELEEVQEEEVQQEEEPPVQQEEVVIQEEPIETQTFEVEDNTPLEEEKSPEKNNHSSPVIDKKFNNQVDQMIYEFQLKSGTDLIFKKVSDGSYIIGTRKVSAKVLNGILLLRVGGGFMDVDSFIKQYGEQELAKQHRQEATQQQQMRASMDSLSSAKSAASKIKVRVKGRNSTASKKSIIDQVLSQKSAQREDSVFESSPEHNHTQPGEYEISLADDDDVDESQGSTSINDSTQQESHRVSPDHMK